MLPIFIHAHVQKKSENQDPHNQQIHPSNIISTRDSSKGLTFPFCLLKTCSFKLFIRHSKYLAKWIKVDQDVCSTFSPKPGILICWYSLTGWWFKPSFKKIISQWEGLPNILWKIKNVRNHQPAKELFDFPSFWGAVINHCPFWRNSLSTRRPRQECLWFINPINSIYVSTNKSNR
jgi:hypothetical protein